MSPSTRRKATSVPSNASTSTSTDDIYSDLMDFLQWCPLHAMQAPGGSGSAGTQKPQTFSQHLHPDLQLKLVTHAPKLAGLLATMAMTLVRDKIIKTQRRPKMTLAFPTTSGLSSLKGAEVLKETSLVDAYVPVASYALSVAVTLEFDSDAWSSAPFYWKSATTRSVAAEGDGSIHMSQSNMQGEVDDGHLNALSLYFNELGMWEFKSLKACPLSVMKAIQEIAHSDSFDWYGCDAEEDCLHVHESTVNPGHPEVRGARVGPDSSSNITKAQCTCAQSPRSGAESSAPQTKIRKKAQWIIQQMWTEAVNLDSTFIILNAGNYEIIGFRCRKTGKLYLSDIIQPSHTKLNVFGVPEKVGYGAIQTGLMLAIIRDAKARALKMQNFSAKGKIPDSWTKHYDRAIHFVQTEHVDPLHSSKTDSGLCLQRHRTLMKRKELPSEDLRSLALQSSHIIFDDHIKAEDCESYTVVRNAAYTRYAPPTRYHEPQLTQLKDIKGTIHLSLRSEVDSDGAFHRLRLNVFIIPRLSFLKQSFVFPESSGFIVKLAAEPLAIGKLQAEFRFYTHMEGRGVDWLPRIVGLYSVEQKGFAHYALVMEFAGGEIGEEEVLPTAQIDGICHRLGQVHRTGRMLHGLPFSKDDIRDRPGFGYIIVSWNNAVPRTSLHTKHSYELEREHVALRKALNKTPSQARKKAKPLPRIPDSLSPSPSLADVLTSFIC